MNGYAIIHFQSDRGGNYGQKESIRNISEF
jgi:hypothetical protein